MPWWVLCRAGVCCGCNAQWHQRPLRRHEHCRPHHPDVPTCSIDGELLRGGLREGQVTEVCGESGERKCAWVRGGQGAARRTAIAGQEVLLLTMKALLGNTPRFNSRGRASWALPCVGQHIPPPPWPTHRARCRAVRCAASGKTQLCLMAAAQTASRGEAVAYIDTSNAFTAGRLLGMLQAVAAAGAVGVRGAAWHGW